MAVLVDRCFKDEEVVIPFSVFCELMKDSARAELMKNAISCEVPHRYIREMLTGVTEADEQKAGPVDPWEDDLK